MFIGRHCDPPSADGVIAVLTIRGRAAFRVWDEAGAHEWDTDDGDLVLMRGGDWPTAGARCPLHEAASPLVGDRVTLTLRHNKAGFGADYFASRHQ